MEYSLQYLNKSANFKERTLKEIVENLNLIGFEVDEIYQEHLEINNLSKTIKLLLKIPANREDLLIEQLLIKEFNRLFSLEFSSNWKKLKKYYLPILKKKYLENINYKNFKINSELKDVLIYNIEIQNYKDFISPVWLQQKLKSFGIQPLNNLNDLINLISFEWGQTIQLSLKDKNSSNLIVEQLKEEKIIFTNFCSTNEIQLPKNSIVLKNDLNEFQNCIGYISEINENFIKNKTINIQAIFYDINLNSSNINLLNTKLSTRYLRKTFLEFFKISIQRFLTLLELLTHNSIVNVNVSKTSPNKINTISTKILKLEKISLLNFLNINDYDENIFKQAGLTIVGKTKKNLYFKISNNRKDLTREIDLVEEYSRFIGYKNFAQIFPSKMSSSKSSRINKYKFLKEFFLNLGFNEVIHSSIEELKKQNNYSINLTNPLNNDFFLLRNELSSKIIETFENNNRLGFLNNNFFEIGRVFKYIEGNLIEEERFVTVFEPFFNKNNKIFSFDWYIHKGFLETLLNFFGYNKLSFELLKIKNSVYHPTRSCLIKSNDKLLGIFGEINPEVFSNKKNVFLLELNLSYFQDSKLLSKINFLKERSKYPSITKDLSFVAEKETNFFELQTILKNSIKYLKNIYIFDIYFEDLKTTKINVGIRFEFQSESETLTNKQIDEEILNIKNLLQTKFCINFMK